MAKNGSKWGNMAFACAYSFVCDLRVCGGYGARNMQKLVFPGPKSVFPGSKRVFLGAQKSSLGPKNHDFFVA